MAGASYTPAHTPSFMRGRTEFRTLLCHVSDKLDENDIKKIKYVHEITSEKVRSGLDVLEALEKQGVFSPNNTDPLAKLLEDIGRNDLAEHVIHAFQTVVPCTAEYEAARSKPVRTSSLSLPTGLPPTHSSQALRRWQTMTHHGSVAVTLSGAGEKSPASLSLSRASSRSDWLDARASSTEIIFTGRGSAFDGDSVSDVFHSRDCSEVSITLRMSMPPSPARSESMISPKAGEQASVPPSLGSPVSDQVPCSGGATLPNFTFANEPGECGGGLTMACSSESASVGPAPSLQPESSPRPADQRRGWKKKLGWKGRKEELAAGRISRHTWIIEKDFLLLERINCNEKVSIDIGCGKFNPYLSLCIYPEGIFEDAGKSMTLQLKVLTPDECPPIPTKATFDLSWEILSNEGQSCRKLKHSKKPTQIQFKTGMEYVHKFLSRTMLPKNEFISLEICLCASTAFSVSKASDQVTDT